MTGDGVVVCGIDGSAVSDAVLASLVVIVGHDGVAATG